MDNDLIADLNGQTFVRGPPKRLYCRVKRVTRDLTPQILTPKACNSPEITLTSCSTGKLPIDLEQHDGST